jgi:hypothetical protein
MSWQARFYLATLFVRHAALGWLCILLFPSYDAISLRYVGHIVPLQAWGVGFLLVAGCVVVALARDSDPLVQMTLGGSATLSMVWCIAFAFAGAKGETAAPIVAVYAFSSFCKDLIVASQPFRRSRLREVARSLANGTGDRWTGGR